MTAGEEPARKDVRHVTCPPGKCKKAGACLCRCRKTDATGVVVAECPRGLHCNDGVSCHFSHTIASASARSGVKPGTPSPLKGRGRGIGRRRGMPGNGRRKENKGRKGISDG